MTHPLIPDGFQSMSSAMKLHHISLVILMFTLSASSEEITGQKLESRDVSVDEAAELIQSNKDLIILDIRTPGEFKEGHLKGARLINFMGDDFDEELAKLQKDIPYLMHCASGGRSSRALAKFKENGFKSVLHLKAGFMGWKKAGKPIEK
jgi:rhodanese-related sulfurtransferase